MHHLICARTWPGGWTFAVYHDLRIAAFSTNAAGVIIPLGRAASPAVAEAIVRCFAARSQCNGFRLLDGLLFAATGFQRRPSWQQTKYRRTPPPEAAIAASGLTPALVPFVYRPGDVGFVITATDREGRFAALPAYGPSPHLSAAAIWRAIIRQQIHFHHEEGRPPFRRVHPCHRSRRAPLVDLLRGRTVPG